MNHQIGRSLIHIDPRLVDIGKSSPHRFRHHLPGEEGESRCDRELTESIRRYGLIQPPLLDSSPGATPPGHVILGHRRLAAAREAGLAAVPVLTVTEESLKSGVVTALWLEEAPSGEPLSELEKIILVDKTVQLAGDSLEELLPGLSRAFGRELSPGFAKSLPKLLSLDAHTLDLLHGGKVSTGELLTLSRHPILDTASAVRLLAGEKLNRREQKEAVSLMVRLCDRGDDAWTSFTSRYRPGEQPLLAALRRACYPSLVRDLEQIDGIISDIGLPQAAAIRPPENLEGGSYHLNIRIRDEGELSLSIKKLQEAIGEGRISNLLKILRGR
jgi:hypothetical protein